MRRAQLHLAGVLGLRTSAARVCRVGVTGKLNHLVGRQAEGLLEASTNLHQDLAALLWGPAFATCRVAVSTSGERLSDALGPETNTVEALANVDYDTHDLAILLVFECLTYSGEHNVEPKLVDVDGLLVLELESPLSTVLVLRVFPFWTDTLLEEMVIRFLCKVGGRSDVVLRVLLATGKLIAKCRKLT